MRSRKPQKRAKSAVFKPQKRATTTKRKIDNRLLEWKEKDQGKTAVLIEGARRTGKRHIAEEFARNEYGSFILIDFSKTPKEIFMLKTKRHHAGMGMMPFSVSVGPV